MLQQWTVAGSGAGTTQCCTCPEGHWACANVKCGLHQVTPSRRWHTGSGSASPTNAGFDLIFLPSKQNVAAAAGLMLRRLHSAATRPPHKQRRCVMAVAAAHWQGTTMLKAVQTRLLERAESRPQPPGALPQCAYWLCELAVPPAVCAWCHNNVPALRRPSAHLRAHPPAAHSIQWILPAASGSDTAPGPCQTAVRCR
jgi:hypothetical protein